MVTRWFLKKDCAPNRCTPYFGPYVHEKIQKYTNAPLRDQKSNTGANEKTILLVNHEENNFFISLHFCLMFNLFMIVSPDKYDPPHT